LLSRTGYLVAVIVSSLGVVLFSLVFASGPRGLLHTINNVAIVIALLQFLFSFWLPRAGDGQSTRELRIVRFGLIAFIGLALWDNLAGLARMTWPRIEPVGFVIFIGCLGYVTAQRAFDREERLLSIEKELDIARRIQQSILPSEFPASARLKVAARYLPLPSVAGDFYDFVIAEQDRAAILIVDVSGPGVPAALIASMVKLAAASQREIAHEPAKFLSGMNSALVGNTQTQFATAACVFFDLSARELRYSAAAHPPMLRWRKGTVDVIEENGLMLAAFDFADYQQKTLPLESGDRFLLYTDGVLEAANSAGEEFGAARLQQRLRETAPLPPAQSIDAIAAAVRAWSPSQDDDITLIVCDVP
jgi:sigma-B regulation protein RsbU (phosphoserine phosphatase)